VKPRTKTIFIELAYSRFPHIDAQNPYIIKGHETTSAPALNLKYQAIYRAINP